MVTKRPVVICLKTRTFAVSQTTKISHISLKRRCDLLENSYFCSIANNLNMCTYRMRLVVICLKTRTFAVSQTTLPVRQSYHPWLWFAWKLVLLQYRKQLYQFVKVTTLGCDLLENSYFCSIANNWAANLLKSSNVVICLKTRTFAVSQTTKYF